jgi:hypothetical protein
MLQITDVSVNISENSMSFMGQITIQQVTFLHIIVPRGRTPLCKESALLTFHIYRMHIS